MIDFRLPAVSPPDLLFELITALAIYVKYCISCGVQCGQYTRDKVVIKLLIKPYFNMLVHRIYSVMLSLHQSLPLLISTIYIIYIISTISICIICIISIIYIIFVWL